MEKILTIGNRRVEMRNVLERVGRVVGALREYYSEVLERRLDTRQTLHLIHAQVAFLFAAFPAETSLAVRAAFGLWFWLAVRKCSRVMGEGSEAQNI
jgi:hypothetical protein